MGKTRRKEKNSTVDQLPMLYKLMTLYTLGQVRYAMTNKQITNLFLDLGYTDYFKAQYALGDLVESGLVTETSSWNGFLYELSSTGKRSIEALKNDISLPIREDIDRYLKSKKLELRSQASNQVSYDRTPSGDYAVHCQVLEGKVPLIDLTLAVPTQQQARTVCRMWEKKSGDIYAYIFRTLSDYAAEEERKDAEKKQEESEESEKSEDCKKRGVQIQEVKKDTEQSKDTESLEIPLPPFFDPSPDEIQKFDDRSKTSSISSTSSPGPSPD